MQKPLFAKGSYPDSDAPARDNSLTHTHNHSSHLSVAHTHNHRATDSYKLHPSMFPSNWGRSFLNQGLWIPAWRPSWPLRERRPAALRALRVVHRAVFGAAETAADAAGAPTVPADASIRLPPGRGHRGTGRLARGRARLGAAVCWRAGGRPGWAFRCTRCGEGSAGRTAMRALLASPCGGHGVRPRRARTVRGRSRRAAPAGSGAWYNRCGSTWSAPRRRSY